MFESIKSKIFKGEAKKSADTPFIATFKNLFGGSSFGENEDLLDKYQGWVFKCINIIGQEISATPLKLYKQSKDGKRVEVTDHELIRLIENPNPLMTKAEFLEAWEASQELDGNAFIWRAKAENALKTQQMWVMRPDWVQIVTDKDATGLVAGYEYRKNGLAKSAVHLDADEVIHCKNVNPKFFNQISPFRGIGTVQASLSIIDEDETIKEWNKKFFKNGAQLGGIIEIAGQVDEAEVMRIQQKWDNKYKGEENANKTAVLAGGMTYKPTGLSQRDLAFIEQRKLDRDEILAMFGVPKGLIFAEDVNLANAQMAVWSFTRFTVRPRLQRIADALNATIVKEYGDEGLYFEFDNPVPEDRQSKVDELVKLTNTVMTVNEARTELGLEPLVGFDELKPKTQPQIQPVQQNTLKKKSQDRITRGEMAWGNMIKSAKPFEDKYLAEIKKYFFKLRKRVLQNYQSSKGMKAVDDLVDDSAEIGAMVDLLDPLQRELFILEGRRALKELGLGSDFTVTDAMAKVLAKWNLKLAGGITDTTIKDVKNVIEQATAEQLGVVETAARLNEYFDYADETRALAIAQSETIRTANSASVFAWQESGMVEEKEWYTAEDERTCGFCVDMDGKTIGLSDNYFNQGDALTIDDTNAQGDPVTRTIHLDYSDVGEPPLHTNCRCTLLPVIK